MAIKFKPILSVTMTQHPVGQGGMMSGLFKSHRVINQFHWIYDCGANRMDYLKREIEKVSRDGDVDCLFISHLDSDHINGIDALLSEVSVREVVMPYLNKIDRLMAISYDLTVGDLSGTFLTFLDNIEGWFSARGVNRITYIYPRSDDDSTDSEINQSPGDGGEGGELQETDLASSDSTFNRDSVGSGWSDQSVVFEEEKERVGLDSSLTIQYFQTGATLHMCSRSGVLNWIFAPYAHRPSDEALTLFASELQKAFPSWNSSSDFITEILRDKLLRERLRNCYNVIWTNHNLVSMALYAGPEGDGGWNQLHSSAFHRPYEWPHDCHSCKPKKRGAIGWLTTGDMDLSVKERRAELFAYYKSLLSYINVLGLPHHGAEASFAPSVLNDLPNVTHCVVAAGKNSYGHPSARVRSFVEKSGRKFIHVNAKVGNVLIWRHSTSDFW